MFFISHAILYKMETSVFNAGEKIKNKLVHINNTDNEKVSVLCPCIEAGEGAYDRSNVEGGADGIDEITDADVNFVGYGDCQ